MALNEDKPLQALALRKAFHRTFAVLPDTARQIARDSDVKDAIRLIGHDVNPTFPHAPLLP